MKRRNAIQEYKAAMRVAVLANASEVLSSLVGDCGPCRALAELAMDDSGVTLEELLRACPVSHE